MDDKSGMDQGGSDFGATTPNLQIPASRAGTGRAVRQTSPVQTPPPKTAPSRSKSPLVWIAIAAGVVLLLIMLVVLILYLTRKPPGFTMIVRGAPPGSNVLVDGASHGVTSADGTIRVTGLKSGRRVVVVSHQGYTDFNRSVVAQDGEEKPIDVQLTPLKKSDPTEIDYHGQMVLIPAGDFMMGDDGHNPNEKPAHKVTLPDYYIDKFEVTNEQYRKFCEETKRKFPTNPWWDNKYFDQPKMPVVGVDFDDASAYATWARKRLPTEEEWEKAASWGPGSATKRMWPWGGSVEAGRATLSSDHTTEVGSNPAGASAYGVQDMAGNVVEWVNAYYQPYPENKVADPNFGTTLRVVRGGHFHADAEEARTTRRIYQAPKFTATEQREHTWLIGFRCAVSANDPKLQEHLRSLK